MQNPRLNDWELILIKPKGSTELISELDAYILLYKQRLKYSYFDELRITVIPTFEVLNNGRLKDFEKNNSPLVWSAKADIPLEEVIFADFCVFIIEPKRLRGRGLGSYLLRNLVGWAKENCHDFNGYVRIARIESETSESEQRRLQMYDSVRIPKLGGKFLISSLNENPSQSKHSRIEKLSIEDYWHQQKLIDWNKYLHLD